MRYTGLRLRGRAAFIGAGIAMLVATVFLTGTVLAADQPTTSTQAPDAIGPHTHQIHGLVKGTPASGATSFIVTTERFGDVSVSFAGATPKGHGHGHAQGQARSFEVAKASDLKDGDRVVVQGHTSSDGKTFIARRVHRLAAKASAHATHIVGTISTVTNTSNGTTTLTLIPASGTASQTVTVNSDTKIHPNGKTVADLKVGTKITVVSKDGAATGVVIMPS